MFLVSCCQLQVAGPEQGIAHCTVSKCCTGELFRKSISPGGVESTGCHVAWCDNSDTLASIWSGPCMPVPPTCRQVIWCWTGSQCSWHSSDLVIWSFGVRTGWVHSQYWPLWDTDLKLDSSWLLLTNFHIRYWVGHLGKIGARSAGYSTLNSVCRHWSRISWSTVSIGRDQSALTSLHVPISAAV